MIGKTISRYKILEKIGAGGMGVVYKAEDIKLNRIVALKFLPHKVSANEEDKKRFMQEARAASAIDHPNICIIHDIDETPEGQLFLSMAYYEGETLRKKISHGQFKINKAVNYTIQIARGLIQAHDREIVHRDIKPANIIITNFEVAKIVDFGLAKFAGQTSITKEGSIMGTVAFMSPEQTRGTKIDHRTDIWSLGIVMYEMICGVCPFLGDSEQAIFYSILNEEPKPLTELRAGVSPKLEWMVEKAIVKNPDDRYQHVDELLVDLLDFEQNPDSEAIQIPRKSKAVSSIAVLPFTDMSQEQDQEYFCDGIAEELINTLARIEGLRVISRTSAFQFKGKLQDIKAIGEQLNVKTVLEGSVRKAENKLRITAQLVKVIDGFQLWSEKFEREMKDVFAIQDEISETIVGALKTKLTGELKAPSIKRYTDNIDAYNDYLQGRYYWSKRTEQGLNKGIEFFNKAIQQEPNYALAYTGLADSFIILGTYGVISPTKSMTKAREATLTALKIDDSLAEAHTSMGFIKSIFDWDWNQAEQDFCKAQALNPNYAPAHHWYAINYLTPQRRFEEAFFHIKKARDLDPLSLNINTTVGLQYYFAQQYDIAIKQFQKSIDMDPNFGITHFFLGQVYVQTDNYDLALSSYEKAVGSHGATTNLLAALAHLYAIKGDETEVKKRLQELQNLKRYVSAYDIAVICTGMGKKDLAFKWLEKASKEHSFLLIYLTVDPKLQSLRSDKRFFQLARKIGLRVSDNVVR